MKIATWNVNGIGARQHEVAAWVQRERPDVVSLQVLKATRERNIGWRLDYVLASSDLAPRAIACPSYREVGTSDHAPVVAASRDQAGA